MVLPKQERKLMLEEALTGARREALKNYSSVDSLSRKFGRAVKTLKTSKEPIFRYKLRKAIQTFRTVPVPQHANYRLPLEDRIQTLYMVLPEVKRLNGMQRIQLIEFIEQNPETFFRTINGLNVERVAKLLGKDLELFARKVDMNEFGRHVGEKLFNFASGAEGNLKYFGKGLMYEEKGMMKDKLTKFGMAAHKHLSKLREGAGYDNYQKFLDGLPKKFRYMFERV